MGPDGHWLICSVRRRRLKLHVPVNSGDTRIEHVYDMQREIFEYAANERGPDPMSRIEHMNGPVIAPPGGPRMPARFHKTLWPVLIRAGANEDRTRRALGLYWRLGMDHRTDVLSAAVRILLVFPLDNAIDWLELFARLPYDAQHAACVLLVETSVARWVSPDGDGEYIERNLRRMIEYPGGPVAWIFLYFTGLSRRLSREYLLFGLALAKLRGDPGSIRTLDTCPDFDRQVVRKLNGLIRTMRAYDRDDALRIAHETWHLAPRFPGLLEIIQRLDTRGLSPEQVFQLLQIYIAATRWPDYNDEPGRLFGFFERYDRALRSDIVRVEPEYAVKYVNMMVVFGKEGYGRESPETLHVRAYRELALRLARPPFSRYDTIPAGIVFALCVDPDQVAIPDSSLRNLEHMMRSDIARNLSERALLQLIEADSTFTRRAFHAFSRKLLGTVRLLGTLQSFARGRVIRAFIEHPLLSDAWNTAPIHDACRGVDAILAREPGLSSPVAKQLHALVYRGEELSAVRKAHYERCFRRDLDYSRLELLDRMIRAKLAAQYPSPRPARDLHTLQMYSLLRVNRKPLRKFLRSTNENGDYIMDHPRTRDWLAAHSDFDQQLWFHGLRTTRRTPEGRELRLAPETSTEEVLKMGTYVGSCLSLGGMYMYNPASVLLDVNKQVVFARDASGSFVARQLLAITKQNSLVCYDVYPDESQKEIVGAFRDYDLSFARALGLPLQDNDDDAYEVECILSEDFYDEYPWDLTV